MAADAAIINEAGKMGMRSGQVELIVAIADAGSLGGAAKALGRSQPAFTVALKRIEEDLGAQLFHHSAQGVIPTPEGQKVIDRSRRILGDLVAIREELAQNRGELVGSVHAIVSLVAAMKVVPSVLLSMRNRFPGVQLQISGGHAPLAFRAIESGAADYVIGPNPGVRPGLFSEQLSRSGIQLLTGIGSRYAQTTDAATLAAADWAVIGPMDRQPLFVEMFASHGLAAPDPVFTSESILPLMSVLENSNLICVCRQHPW
ncbi:LysR family transcriptional regulator, partial [Maritimibacter sp. UBA3975]